MKPLDAMPPAAASKSVADLVSAGNSPAELTATIYLRELAARRISAHEYLRACFDRIEAIDPILHAFKLFNRERAEQRAREVDARLKDGTAPAPMAGVPVGVKDIFNTYDFVTGMGSPILEHYTPGNDARVVSNMRLDGAIVAGKTVTAEFAVHNPGPTLNPYDLKRTPGTSSSGSAVAVATRMVPLALATQTAGSIIRPASYTGIMGFKPSFGLIPRTAMLKTTDTLDTVGFMARSVDDLQLAFETTRVRGHNYPVSEQALADPARQAPPPGSRWRVALLKGPMSGYEAAPVASGLTELARRLERSGCDVFEYTPPRPFWDVHELHEIIYRRALAYYFRYEWKTHADLFSPIMRQMIEGGLALTPEQYQQAIDRQVEISRLYDQEAGKFDVLITPSTADEAPVGLGAPDLPDHCLVFTFVGAPVLGMPGLRGTAGLPVGVQLASRRFADYRLLAFGRMLEALQRGAA